MFTETQATQPDPAVIENFAPNSELSPAEAVLLLQTRFRRAARKLARDRNLADDLVQEMSLAVLYCKKPGTLSWFRQLGLWRAVDYLRRVSDRPKHWLDKATNLKLKLLNNKEFSRIQSLINAQST